MISIIPITSKPNNTFSCKIPVDSANLTLVFKTHYNEVAGYWIVSVSKGDGTELIHNLPMLPAQNILEQFSYMEIGAACILSSRQVAEQWPNADNLGSEWLLVWGDTP